MLPLLLRRELRMLVEMRERPKKELLPAPKSKKARQSMKDQSAFPLP